MKELSEMKEIPENFIQYYKAIINAISVDELKNLCHVIILSTRKFMIKNNPKKYDNIYNTNFQNLAD